MVERTAAPAAETVVPVTDRPLVSVVVVTYGTGAVVLDALRAVVAWTSVPVEVIVVDNVADSAPATRELLRQATSGVELVTPEANLGFGGGCEAGAAVARGDYLCFLNPDVIVVQGWLEPLLAALEDPVVAVAAPVLRDPDGALQEAGQAVLADGCTMAVGGPELFPGDESQVFDRDVDYASAACWLVRREEHLARGGFDPRYHPAFFEDADYGMRVERDGQVSRLVTDVPVTHLRGGGGAGRDLTIPERSREVFRDVWRDRLGVHPNRPRSPDEALALRDRLARRRVLYTTAGIPSASAARSMFERALGEARAHPRDRVTFATDRRDVLAPGDRERARRAGLEVLLGDLDSIGRERLGWATDHPSGDATVLAARRDRWPAGFVAVAVVALVGILTRWIILRSPAGRLNADEAYTGVQAFEILHGRFPVVLGGTVYTAVFEAYVYAPFAALFGGRILLLKLIAVASWAIAAVLVGAIARDLAGRRAGVVAFALAWVTPGALLTVSTNAYAGYGSGMALTAAAFLAARRVVDREEPGWCLPGLVGLASGLAFWAHPMFLATLLPMLAVTMWRHRRRLEVWAGVTAGGIIGCGPLLVWNAVNAWPSLESPVQVEGTYAERLSGFVRDLVPRAFGLRDGALEWMLGPAAGGTLYALLVVGVVAGAVLVVRRDGRPSRLLLPAVLVGVFPLMALFPPLIYANDGRYGIVAFPFLVVALGVTAAHLLDLAHRRVGRPGPATIAVGAVLAAIWLGGFVGPHVRELADLADGDPNAGTHEVAGRIRAAGVEHVYGSYWRVHPVDFVADDELTGGVLAPFPVRFPERQRAVEVTAPDAVAFVFQTEDEDPSRLWLPVEAYRRETIGDTVLYLPLVALERAEN